MRATSRRTGPLRRRHDLVVLSAGLRPVFTEVDGLDRHTDPRGKNLLDVPDGGTGRRGGPLRSVSWGCTTTCGSPTPTVTASPAPRSASAGWASTAASPRALFVDGWFAGMWRVEDGKPWSWRVPLADAQESPGSTRSSTRLVALLGVEFAGWTLLPRRPHPVRQHPSHPRHDVRHLGTSDRRSASAACGTAAPPPPPRPRSRYAAPPTPSRTACAPAASNAASSSSVSPPSGPTTTTSEPAERHVERRPATTAPPRAARRPGRRRRRARPPRRSWPVGSTSGNHDAPRLLGGLARRRAPPGQRLLGPLALPDRDAPRAAHGTIRATPTSVSTSTASSPRSPLGMRLHDGRPPARARRVEHRATSTENTRLPVAPRRR